MKQIYKSLILTAVVILQAMASASAQDVTFDLTQGPSPQSKDGVSVAYKWYAEGAHIFNSGNINNQVVITSTKNIVCIKFEGKPQKTGNVIACEGEGTFKFRLNSTSVWEGKATRIVFGGENAQTEYFVKKLHVWFEGTPYNPDTDSSEDEDDKLIGTPLERASAVPVDGMAVKMAIVAARQFQEIVEEYGDWKTQQGYEVEEIYADDYKGGTSTDEEWAQKIQARLRETRPAFILIVGDHYHVPAFSGKTFTDKPYATDYYYTLYADDSTFPNAYIGRFSGHDDEDIKAQMDKTKHMSLLPAHKAGWLKNCLAINNSVGEIASMTTAHEYLVDYFKGIGDAVVTTEAAATNTINNTISEGCAVASYFGHGSTTCFNNSYYNSDADKLTNDGKYPIFLAMTCLTGNFDIGNTKENMCLAEKMQRMPNAGTVAYIGATHESYTSTNILFVKGTTAGGQSYLGFLGSMFPQRKNDRLNQHARTIGEAVAIGSYSATSAGAHWAKGAAEYTELFGDPTYQPYCTTPLTMNVGAPAQATAGHIIKVKAAPDAVVCVSADRTIAAVGLTDSEGCVELKLSKEAAAGAYTLYCSAPGYTDWNRTIALTAFDGQEDKVDENEDGEPSTFNFDDFSRKKVLIEKFTGQQCQYCASDDAILDSYINGGVNLQDKIYELRYYTYTNDQLSMPVEPYDVMRRPWGISGHPAYMVDRHGYGADETYSNCGFTTRAQNIKSTDWVNHRYGLPCYVSLSLDGSTYDPDTKQLKVVVSGKAAKDLPDLRINLFIAQNKIYAYQSGGGSQYEHNGVSRAFLTDNALGDKFEMYEDSTFQIEKTYTIPEKYSNIATDPSQMDIVAFISSWDDYAYPQGPTGKDFEDCEVHNTVSTCIGELPRKAQKPMLPNGLTPVGPPTKRTEITIADGTTYTTTVAKHYDSVTYTRDYEDTNWQALYVPFAINYNEWSEDYEIARVYNYIEYDDDQDGINDRTILVFQKKNAGSTEPNTPYLIRAKVAGEKSLTVEDRTLQPAKINSVDCGSVDYDYTFTGTYTPITDIFTRGYYTLCDGAMRLADSATGTLSPQRWYMEVTPRRGAHATRAQVIQFFVEGEDGVEGIEQLTTPGATYTSYDLQGRYLAAPMKRGIQLVNGRKIVR